ncbi:MAG: hypothetical protein HWN68_18545 [Desulfobacterales bacterium]|nr:hypothetical protein [Desulfobacterales bacterium]
MSKQEAFPPFPKIEKDKIKTRRELVEECRKWSDKDLAWHQRFVNLHDAEEFIEWRVDTRKQLRELLETHNVIDGVELAKKFLEALE